MPQEKLKEKVFSLFALSQTPSLRKTTPLLTTREKRKNPTFLLFMRIPLSFSPVFETFSFSFVPQGVTKCLPPSTNGKQHVLFFFRYKKNSSTRFTAADVEPPRALNYTIYNLEPGTWYTFQVYGGNKFGHGRSSRAVTARTQGETVFTLFARGSLSLGNFT